MARGTRTHDNQIHNLALYQLNYSHHIWAVCPLLSFCFRKTSFLGNSPYFPTSTFVLREPCFFKYARDVSNDTCGNPFTLPISSHFDIRLARTLLFYDVCPLLSFCFRKTLFDNLSISSVLYIYYLFSCLKIRIAPQFGVEHTLINS